MTATLATLRARVQQYLTDVSAVAYTTATLDEALRQTLSDYSDIYPRIVDTVIVAPAAGREIALAALTDLTAVLAVYWPYDSLNPSWPPNQVTGFSLEWDDGQPLLVLSSDIGLEPQADDEIRLKYATPQHLDGLDDAAGTTLLATHESWIVTGAAAYAAIQRAGDVSGTYANTPRIQANLENWAHTRLAMFRSKLAQLSITTTQRGQVFGAGWQLDKDDV